MRCQKISNASYVGAYSIPPELRILEKMCLELTPEEENSGVEFPKDELSMYSTGSLFAHLLRPETPETESTDGRSFSRNNREFSYENRFLGDLRPQKNHVLPDYS